MDTEDKRRRQGKRTWYPHEDHLAWLCDCHDCRGRRKRGDVTIPSRRERRERDRERVEAQEATGDAPGG